LSEVQRDTRRAGRRADGRLAAANTRDQFNSALFSRDQIGQAKGMLMERFSIDAVHAFNLLRTLSQQMNTPVREVAARLTTRR
jgi:AmiR/NasT family two-component response regulator